MLTSMWARQTSVQRNTIIVTWMIIDSFLLNTKNRSCKRFKFNSGLSRINNTYTYIYIYIYTPNHLGILYNIIWLYYYIDILSQKNYVTYYKTWLTIILQINNKLKMLILLIKFMIFCNNYLLVMWHSLFYLIN